VCHLEATDPQLIRKYAEDLKNKCHQKGTIPPATVNQDRCGEEPD